jgi:hypothetical protein
VLSKEAGTRLLFAMLRCGAGNVEQQTFLNFSKNIFKIMIKKHIA